MGKKSVSHINIVGRDELHQADVIQERGENKILVKSKIELSSDLRIFSDSPQDTRLSNGVDFLDIYDETGDLTISGFIVKFDRNESRVRLEIDGIEIFDLSMFEIEKFLNLASAFLPNTYISWNSQLNTFYFTPNFPIVGNAIKISVIGTANNTDYLGSIIQVG